MSTNPIRVTEAVHREVHAAARVLGCNAAELLERAWSCYRETPEFGKEFHLAQKAFSVGDVGAVADLLHQQGAQRAQQRAMAVQALRG